MQPQRLLDDLARSAGLPGLKLDAEGRLTLSFDDRLEVTIDSEPEEGRFVLSALVGEVGTAPGAAILGELLDGNFFWQGTGGPTLAVERATGRVVLVEQLPLAGLDARRLEAALNGFVAAGIRWHDRLVGAAAAADMPAPVDSGHLLAALQFRA